MIRRSFRIGLVLGVLAGLGLAIAKALQSRRSDDASSPPREGAWPPIQQPERPPASVTAPAAPPRPAPPPVRPTPAPPPPATPAPRAEAPAAPARPEPATPASDAADRTRDDDILPPADEPAPATRPTGRKAAGKKATKRAPAKKAAAKKRGATKKAAAKRAAGDDAARAWVEPSGDTCPGSHPIKAKLSSKIFHLPGMFAYDRTNPDRCYRDEDAAAADGLRRAKR